MATKASVQTVTGTPKRQTLTEKYKSLSETLERVENDREVLVEALSNAVAMLRQEDIGWAAPGESGKYNGLTLKDLQGWSAQIRASLTGTADRAPNPHMRNGLMLRHSFIWDGGIHYEGLPEPTRGKINVRDRIEKGETHRLVFGKSARRRREHALFADGVYLLLGANRTKELRPIPLAQISETHRHPLYEDEIIAYRWSRRVIEPGSTVRKEEHSWVYVDWYNGPKADKIRYNNVEEDVLKGHTMFDMHANRPDGAPFGSPDAIAALVWARIIRDLIMNGVKMQDALAMFAFRATAETKKGQQNLSLELAEDVAAGSAAVLGGGQNLVPLSSAGRGYDFGSIGFVVSTMAASLHVSGIALSANTALAGSSYGAARTLDLPGRMAMEARRAEHIEFDERLLRWMGAEDATAYFNNYDDATDEYRAVQAVMLLWSSGTLTPEAFRAELENIYGHKFVGPIPEGVMLPNNFDSLARKDVDTDEYKVSKSTAAPDQGRSNGTGGAGHLDDLTGPAAE